MALSIRRAAFSETNLIRHHATANTFRSRPLFEESGPSPAPSPHNFTIAVTPKSPHSVAATPKQGSFRVTSNVVLADAKGRQRRVLQDRVDSAAGDEAALYKHDDVLVGA
eukprot:CAMPEP_0180327420 /NCGR_PEP_ID=MMETSP0988-20121125/39559_1 /TAXON_ID=697907 /ORGANISM="non described non described, Strain CCMP2293" /LENGTH=109 /DNA_ID=CAMNT_0022314137 /DNA_START=9 /DNA_END=339 /DNA_ORIENTATION=-